MFTRLLTLSLALGLWTSNASAGVVRMMDLPTLVSTADTIVVGEVIAVKAAWRGTRIITQVQVQASSALKGQPGDSLTVEVLGGEVGGIGQKVSGMAAFTVGEPVVLFLNKSLDGTFKTVGLSQGKLSITVSLRGIETVRTLDGLTLMNRVDTQWVPVHSPLPLREDIHDFLAQLATALPR